MNFKFDVQIKPSQEIIERLGLNPGGRVQKHFTGEVIRWSDDYVPMDSGVLKNNTSELIDGTGFTYESPYVHYQYIGDLYVDPIAKVGAFPIRMINGEEKISFNNDFELVGFKSRSGVPKVKDPKGRKLNNWNGKRGPYWVERMWADNGDTICRELENFIRSGRND